MGDVSSASSSVSEDSNPPTNVDYPLRESVAVPGTSGGVHKKVLTVGNGTRPVKGAKVTVHYVGNLEDNTVFDSSRERNEPFSFTLGKGQVIKGWDKGVATMQIGETAELRCTPEYAYGAAGSPPTIPPNATLLFVVELLDWTCETDISPGKDRSLMKDTLVDGEGYEKPEFESDVTLDVVIYSGHVDMRHVDAAHLAQLQPLWQQQQWKVTVGDTPLPPQLEQCLMTMRTNEVAVFRVHGDLVPAAGDVVHNIPARDTGGVVSVRTGDAGLTYRVHLHTMQSVKSWAFSGAAKIAEGVARKDKGNAAFQRGDLALAERYYRRALEFVGENYGVADEDKAANMKARVVVMGNLAQVLLHERRYSEAREYCTKVLELEHNNTKALYRLAKVQDALQEWDSATRTLDRLLALEPGNADACALRAQVRNAQSAYDAKQKSLYKRLFV